MRYCKFIFMKPYYLLFLISFIVTACNSNGEKKVVKTIDPKILITCDGIGEVKLGDSYDDLRRKFGDTALSAHENNIRGKFTSIWADQPNHINIYWKEKSAPYKTIKYMEAVNGMAPYMTKDSIMVGMNLRDLVRKNGSMAITFRNFSMSEAPGIITGFNNGEIPKVSPCFEGVLEWAGQKPIDVHELNDFQKQEEVKSFDRILQRMDVVLATIRLSSKK